MWFSRRHRPELSVVVVVHNMAREAPRTLYSLSASYQRHIGADDYEIIVVDNGSTLPFDAEVIDGLTGNFRLLRLDPAPASPARAINRGLAEARGKVVGVMIDGARIVTPGLLHFARRGVELYPRAVAVTLGWYLGRDLQRWSMEAGYNQQREDEMLASIGWPQDGYRLFDIAAFDESSVDGWFSQIEESNALFLSRDSWDRLGGVDDRFDAPGGGYINLDTLGRAMELPDSELVVLLGEATFHQLHGGIATNQSYRNLAQSLSKWEAQYQAIRQRPWRAPSPPKRTYIGTLPQSVLPHLARAVVEPARGQPLGPSFDRSLWQTTHSPRPSDPICAALVDLAESEFRSRRFPAAAAVARMARNRAPDEPAPQHLLAIAGAWLRDAGEPPDNERAGFHLARAKAYRLLDDPAAAETEFRAALDWNADLAEAKSGLEELRSRDTDTAERDLSSQGKGSASSPIRQAIVVLGMHRSGTSALAGVLCGLGAAAPKKTLMGPHPCNQKGLFEALGLAKAHDEFLAAAGTCWHDWRKFDLQWARTEAAAQYSAKIRTVLTEEFGDEPMIVLKDPRICRFVPYTLSLLADLNMSPVAVLPVRNPLEVALSLQQRDHFELPKSIMLWLRHVLDAEYFSRSLPRCLLPYEGLLQNWRHHVDRIAEQTDVAWPDRSDRSAVEIDQFLTTELYHERATWDETKDHREVLELARHTYRILMDVCARGENRELRDQLDAARAEFDDSCRTFEAPMAAEDVAQSRS
jgi:glycosyltransferase involved in cell wall biosynthesis